MSSEACDPSCIWSRSNAEASNGQETFSVVAMPLLPLLQALSASKGVRSSQTRLRTDIARKVQGIVKPDLSASHCNSVHMRRSLGPAMQALTRVSTLTKVADRCCMSGYQLRRLLGELRKASTSTTCQHHPGVLLLCQLHNGLAILHQYQACFPTSILTPLLSQSSTAASVTRDHHLLFLAT